MARKIINFSTTQKRYIAISIVALAITGIFVVGTFSGNSEETESNNSTSNSSISGIGNNISNVESNNPDTESIVDESSPISSSAREAEEREAQRARETGSTYIGNIFNSEGRDNTPIIEVPNYNREENVQDNEPIQNQPEPEPQTSIDVPEVPNQSQQNNKAVVPITMQDLTQGYGNSINLNNVIGSTDNTIPNAGSLTTFLEYEQQNQDSQNNINSNNRNLVEGSVRDNMYEAYTPRNRNRDDISNEFRIALGAQFYTTIAFAINSDDNGPALAVIREGPLKGAKLIGEQELNELSKAVNINYNRMSYKGQDYDINAIAYNLNNDRPVLSDDVNNHYLQRYGGLFLSAFVASYAETFDNQTTVIGDSGNVTTIDQPIEREGRRARAALSGPASILTEELRNNVNRPITVYVNEGSGAGVLFLDPVTISE